MPRPPRNLSASTPRTAESSSHASSLPTEREPAAREVVNTRMFDVPREVLFRAFSDPRHLARWWGPRGFTNTFHEFDLKPGGRWRLVMHGPDGTHYANEKRFLEVTAPERVVFEHAQPMHTFQMTMTFTPEAAGTRLTWRLLFDSAEEAARLRDLISTANEENFDRLEAYLPKVA